MSIIIFGIVALIGVISLVGAFIAVEKGGRIQKEME